MSEFAVVSCLIAARRQNLANALGLHRRARQLGAAASGQRSPRPFLRGLIMREGVRIRLIHFGVALLAALIAAISPAAASSLTIGLPANNGTSITSEQIGGYACQPFGCPTLSGGGTSLLSWTPEYQQVYAKTAFTLGSYTLTGISFPVSVGSSYPSGVGAHLNGGTFQNFVVDDIGSGSQCREYWNRSQ
jgi:hypothetical protein